jgi:phosphoglycolate phosphatase-like HAD superfamily hydrolase
VGIATCSPRENVEKFLRRENLSDCISAIITDSEAPRPKPHPDMLLTLIEELDGTPNSSLMVGDADSDRQMARSAGVRFLHLDTISGNKIPSAATVDNWDDLAYFVLKMDSGC